ncbi:Hly-III-related protein [Cordyceps fumosorosea ARSEF 2679]|uniref:Hly-III-related protein n=1 Tax=Cordyceps fumosorosea (strain ARSEF 2679) TaxID=1081104 RepID=A0A167ZEI4_CORFA|nr:Hly-III-related protein [Cordyceps fumosorosea ARSEF 2679]OAA67416.1 Hly-III-related protein [Cordyceps fumosorosea ARSEF 2679]
MRQATNIWSHLLGAALFLLGLVNFLHLRSLASEDGSWASDVAAVGVYYLCVVVCFVLSTAFHTFADHSAAAHRFGNELDHLGIVLVMWGTGVSGAHFTLYCEPPGIRALYHAALTSAAVGCGVFTLRPAFRHPTYRTMRFLMYCGLGASLFAPALHGWARSGSLAAVGEMMGLGSFLGLAGINFAGAALYAARVPERWFPGTFDLLGQSHNLMHVLVFTGALVRLNGLLAVMEQWRQDTLANGFCQSVS